MLNVFEDKKGTDDGVRCVLRVGTLSELWLITSMAVEGDYDASKIRPHHVDTGQRTSGMRPGYDRIYDAHFAATIGSIIVMYPNAILGRKGSRFFEVTTDGLQEIANRDGVLQILTKSGRVEPIEENA